MKINSKLNKILTLSVTAVILAASIPAAAENNDIIEVYVNNKQVAFDVNPIIENERTLVPLRAIFEALGAEVTWDENTRTASAVRGSDTMSIAIDSNVLYKNGSAVELDVPARIINDRTLVPVRAVSESFNAEVSWDDKTRSVYIVTEDEVEQFVLSDADLQTLINQKEDIRYNFERFFLPDYVFANETLYHDMGNADIITNDLYNRWELNTILFASNIMLSSETEYPLNNSNIFLIAPYKQILETAGLDYQTIFEGVTNLETENGTRISVLTFKSADSNVQCKHIGIIKSEHGEPGYFTAENDPYETDVWFFCEVTMTGIDALCTFEKADADTDFDNFINLMETVYSQN